jgi:3',5'-cyclic AMP phosphodiesterase CpdA
MTFAIVADLHLGRTGPGRWHNRLLYDQAEPVARAAVAALNGQRLDAVYVLGDITDAGEDGQLALAGRILADLEAPWFVLPGNHDLAAMRTGAFQTAFRGHLLPELACRDGVAIVGLHEDTAPRDRTPGRFALDEQRLEAIARQIERLGPSTLIVFSHQPLAADPDWPRVHGGKDAGHFTAGRPFLERAARPNRRLVAFCAHQHWHRVLEGPGWRQCTTAALIEYPVEARLVTLDAERVSCRILPVAPEAAAASLESAAWVAGRPNDREWTSPQ